MGIRLLVVDDELIQLGLIAGVIRKLFPEYQVDTTHRPSEALEMLRAGCYNALITDVKMPDMDGLELVRQVREMGLKPMQVVILSGFNEFAYARQALRYGAVDYLLKPVSKGALQETLLKVERALREDYRVSSLDASAQMLSQQTKAFALYKLIKRLPLNEQEQYIIDSLRIQERPYTVTALTQLDREGLEALEDEEVCLVEVDEGCFALLMPSQRTDVERAILKICAEEGRARAAISMPVKGDGVANAYARVFELALTAQAVGVGLIRQSPKNEQVPLELTEAMRSCNQSAIREADYALRMAMIAGSVSMKDARDAVRHGLDGLVSSGLHFSSQEVDDAFRADAIDRICNCSTPEAITALAEELLPGREESDAFKRGCLAYIAQNYTGSCALTDISKAFHYTPSHFSRLFTASFNMAYSRYLSEYRLDCARKLMLTTDLAVGEVAKCVGLQDPCYFNRQFSKRFGVSPQKYRRRGG